MMAIGFTVLLLVWVAIYIGEPFKFPRSWRGFETGESRAIKLRDDYDRTLEALKDLEFEHAAGKLSDADFNRLKDSYMARAVELTRQLNPSA